MFGLVLDVSIVAKSFARNQTQFLHRVEEAWKHCTSSKMTMDTLSCKGLGVRLDAYRVACPGYLSRKFGFRTASFMFAIVLRKSHLSSGQHDLCHNGVGDDMMRLAIHGDASCGCATRKINGDPFAMHDMNFVGLQLYKACNRNASFGSQLIPRTN